MSLVTDLVFVTPGLAASERFADLYELSTTVRDGHDLTGRYEYPWRPTVLMANGPKCAGSYVYYIGANYLSFTLVEELHAEPWPRGTVLYLWHEADDEPRVTTW